MKKCGSKSKDTPKHPKDYYTNPKYGMIGIGKDWRDIVFKKTDPRDE
jgi:hypothetical protein